MTEAEKILSDFIEDTTDKEILFDFYEDILVATIDKEINGDVLWSVFFEDWGKYESKVKKFIVFSNAKCSDRIMDFIKESKVFDTSFCSVEVVASHFMDDKTIFIFKKG